MPIERITPVQRIFQRTIGEVRRGGYRSVSIPHARLGSNSDIVEWWNRPSFGGAWAEGGGIVNAERKVVKKRLKNSGFYDGLTPESSILDLAVGAQTYLDADLIPPGATVDAADFSQTMLDALQASQEKSGVRLHTSFRRMDATSLDYPDNSLQRILFPFAMRYLSPAQQKIAILEMIRASEDQGRIDIIDFDTVENYGRQEASMFTPARMEDIIFNNPFFEPEVKKLGSEVTVSMDEIIRPVKPFSGRLYHLQLIVHK